MFSKISARGKKWQLNEGNEELFRYLTATTSYPELLCRLLSQRHIPTDQVERFLNPTLRDQLPDPSHLRDMDQAVARIVAAIENQEIIGIWGDYDVDGATSSALMYRFLTAVGARQLLLHIPDRFEEGYGVNLPELLKLQQQGASLVITLDCGTTAHAVINAATEQHQLDMIVLDHHGADPTLPKAVAVVNPNRQDETSPLKYVAAVGLSFVTAVAINRALRQRGWYSATRPEPNLMALLDLVALGTVCDVVPLVDLNRAFVSQGLKVMRTTNNLGLQTLIELSKAQPEQLDVYHLGYLIGPRINAGGRIGKASLGARLLVATDAAEAWSIGCELNRLNLERRAIEQEILAKALQQAESQANEKVIIVSGYDWHEGVIGIIAGRVKDKYHRPAFVISWQTKTLTTADGTEQQTVVGKGSARSISNFDIGAMIRLACQQGLLAAGGGHAMAGGITVLQEQFPAFVEFMRHHAEHNLQAQDLLPTLKIDSIIDVGALNLDLVNNINRLGPFGSGNPSPRFACVDVMVSYAEVLRGGHIRCRLFSSISSCSIDAMLFGAMDTELGQILLNNSFRTLAVAGGLSIDTWQQQNKLKFIIDDIYTPPLSRNGF